MCSARAGNVIGGGDWSKDRIVVDMITSWSNGNLVNIRSPDATRPWQHVLEPISGYLHLGSSLASDGDRLNGMSFNFGPKSEQSKTVVELASDLFTALKAYVADLPAAPYLISDNKPFHEAGLLKLCCDKALFHLRWESNLQYAECIELIAEWYGVHLRGGDTSQATSEQLNLYAQLAEERGLVWTR